MFTRNRKGFKSMVIRRWEPFREFTGVREAIGHFGNGLTHPYEPRAVYRGSDIPRVDAYHTQDSLVVKVAIPGVRPEDVDVTVTGNILTIKGEVKGEDEVDERSYLIREQRYGTFSRTLTLPKGLKTDEIEATYGEGVFTLTIPKADEIRPKEVKVTVKPADEGKQAA